MPLKYSIRLRSESSAAALLKNPSVRVGVQNDLKGVDDRRFSAAGMSGKEIDPFTERKHFPFNIMPVIQTDLR